MQGNSERMLSSMDYFSEATRVVENHCTIAESVLRLGQTDLGATDHHIVSDQLCETWPPIRGTLSLVRWQRDVSESQVLVPV